uniref:Phosphatidylinositol-glycan biosynthesis class X protein n=3 Tax=Xenopus tropicalis TaxID=8364 RepID=A0A803JTN4_XENTR
MGCKGPSVPRLYRIISNMGQKLLCNQTPLCCYLGHLTMNQLVWLAFICIASNSANESPCPELLARRGILNKGYHRDLETSVVVQGPAELVKHCRVLIQEHIPSGLYLDPYQLSSLRHHNLTEVLLLTPVDVEAPEYLSRGHTALVYTKPDPSCAHCYTSTVPLHIRYHRPASQTDKVSITLQNPKLLLNCGQDFPPTSCSPHSVTEAPCDLKDKELCQWLDLPYTADPNALNLEVPVGLAEDGPIVCAVTLIVTLICAGMILGAVYRHGQRSV